MDTVGALEEIVLMILLKYEECHGVQIAQHYEAILDKTISLPAIHVVLKRMEKKGWVDSKFGEPTAKRGGRRKRLYRATSSGYHAIEKLQEAKSKLWASIAQQNFKYGAI